jgi:tetratricopeptide (TPR) repeat protein
VLSYIEALAGNEQWLAAVDVAVQIPLAEAPTQVFEALSQLALDLHGTGEQAQLDRLHDRIRGATGLGPEARQTSMRLADAWRERGEFLRAFQLYRNIQASDGPNQTIAQLWVAYCSFYLGHELIPEVFLDILPEMESGDEGYSLRELIRARLAMRDDDFDAAMRHAAEGKTYANAIDPWYPELLYTVAHLYEARGMEAAARAAYREVAAIFTESPWAAESQQALQSLTSQPYNL